MDQTKARERNHSLKITSGTYNPEQTVDEVGVFVMRNGVTGKEHNITLWASGSEEDGTIEEIALYIDDPEEILRLTDDGMSVDGAASDALIDYTLNDLIKNEEELRPYIEKYAMDPDAEYEHDIPLKVIKVDLHDLIVKEEITDLIMKNDRGVLSKEDLLEFGKLVERDATTYNVDRELKEAVGKILREQSLDHEKSELMKSAFKSLMFVNGAEEIVKVDNQIDNPISFSETPSISKGKEEVELSK